MKKRVTPDVLSSSEGFDYQSFESDVIQGLLRGESLLGEDGLLAPMLQNLLNAALLGEARSHLKDCKSDGIANRLNGHTNKRVQTVGGPVDIRPPRDRNGTFEPQLIPKWDRTLGSGVDKQILSLYAQGNSVSDVQHLLRELYGLDYSTGLISEVTEQVMPELVAWQQRAIPTFLTALFLDGIYFTSREGGRSQKKVLFVVLGIDAEGKRHILGLYIRHEESASNWGQIMEDLKRRGLEDVLFVCVDGLTGFGSAINHVYPQAIVQRCIVHIIRNSTKHVPDKDKKEVCADLRLIYTASDELQARMALDAFTQKWGKYKEVSRIWEQNWTDIIPFLDYGTEIRRLIYTTNAIEGLNRQIRKVTKTKGGWANDKALMKQVYISLFHGKKGWEQRVKGWQNIKRELIEKFGDRYERQIE